MVIVTAVKSIARMACWQQQLGCSAYDQEVVGSAPVIGLLPSGCVTAKPINHLRNWPPRSTQPSIRTG